MASPPDTPPEFYLLGFTKIPLSPCFSTGESGIAVTACVRSREQGARLATSPVLSISGGGGFPEVRQI